MTRTLRIGTRGSALALAQTGTVAEALKAAGALTSATLATVQSGGDGTMAGIVSAQGPAVPEIEFDVELVCGYIDRRFESQYSPIIVVSEGAVPAEGGDMTLQSGEKDAFGHVRLGGIGDRLAKEIEDRTGKEARAVVLGHIQRGGTPTAFDRWLATRFGLHAIAAVHDGDFGTMMALRGTRIDRVPLAEGTRLQTPEQMAAEKPHSWFYKKAHGGGAATQPMTSPRPQDTRALGGLVDLPADRAAGPRDGIRLILDDVHHVLATDLQPAVLAMRRAKHKDVALVKDALERYTSDVRSGAFPGDEHTYSIPEEELAEFEAGLAGSERK